MENPRPIAVQAGPAEVQAQPGAKATHTQAGPAGRAGAAEVPVQATEAVMHQEPVQVGGAVRGDQPEVCALVPVDPAGACEEGFAVTPAIGRLPVELDVVIPVREFRVRQLLALEPGQVIASQWKPGDDVPLAAGDVQLAWSEFEVIEEQLAVRVTRLP